MRRNSGIDLLRGLAAFGIVGCHLSLGPETAGAAWLRHFCDFNVAVFAVLAGLMMGSVDACETLGEKTTYILKVGKHDHYCAAPAAGHVVAAA